MAFRLEKKESASAGIRRIAREEIDDAIDLAEDRTADSAETVHELRKKFKKIRAVVRLVREPLGDRVFRRENEVLRDLGRKLSPARDAAVRVSALENLQARRGSGLSRADVTPLQRRLVARHRIAVARVRTPASMSGIAGELRDLRRRVRAWPLDEPGFACMEAGLRRAYRKGKRGASEAYESRTDDAFHEWRKRAKDLRYHVEILGPAWHEPMRSLEKELHELTDRLGDDHDLADLRRTLASARAPTKDRKLVALVIDRIARRRSELQAKARPIGARVYAEKPKDFSARIESYWDAWRS